MCGEHFKMSLLSQNYVGSPPHVRGTRAVGAVGAVGAGITPACAGNTKISCTWTMLPSDHPRMCGEHPTIVKDLSGFIGSPPHVRGTLGKSRGY